MVPDLPWSTSGSLYKGPPRALEIPTPRETACIYNRLDSWEHPLIGVASVSWPCAVLLRGAAEVRHRRDREKSEVQTAGRDHIPTLSPPGPHWYAAGQLRPFLYSLILPCLPHTHSLLHCFWISGSQPLSCHWLHFSLTFPIPPSAKVASSCPVSLLFPLFIYFFFLTFSIFFLLSLILISPLHCSSFYSYWSQSLSKLLSCTHTSKHEWV